MCTFANEGIIALLQADLQVDLPLAPLDDCYRPGQYWWPVQHTWYKDHEMSRHA